MKQKTKNNQGRTEDEALGDAYCFIGIERNTKMILAWHLGRRTEVDTIVFTEKLAHATRGNSQKAGTSSPYTNRMDLTYSYSASSGQMGSGSTAGNAEQLMSISGTIGGSTESATYLFSLYF